MERNLSFNKKQSDIFGLLFLGDGVTIYRTPLFNILVSGRNLAVAVSELVYCQGHLAYGVHKYGTFIFTVFFEHIKN